MNPTADLEQKRQEEQQAGTSVEGNLQDPGEGLPGVPQKPTPGELRQKSRRSRFKAFIIGGVVALVLGVGAFLYWSHARQFVKTDDAYTAGHVHQVSSRVMGLVQEVRVDDNQVVQAGDVLVVLDPKDYEVGLSRARSALKEAEARVGTQQAAIGQSRAGISAAEAQVEKARAGVSQSSALLEKARLDYERVSGLFTRDLKAVSKADVDAVTANFESARSALEAARAELSAATAEAESSKASSDAAVAQLEVTRANVTSAQSAVRNAELQLSYTKVVAPVGGKISRKTVEEGQQIQPGQALLAVVPDEVWIIANLKENQLEQVQLGQRVDIKIDSLPHQTFYGSVHSIQEGTGSTFALLPPDNATGNFTKIVQRVPIKIVFDPESIRPFREKIVPGLSVVPHIDIRSLENNRREAKRSSREQKQNQEAETDAR